MLKSLAAVAAFTAAAYAQRPANTSICDFYTTALFTNNTAANQLTLLTALVNTAVIGNYTKPNMNAVPGILAANATINGKPVNLAQYFTGALQSTNRGGSPVSVNFLDGGGAAPLMNNTAANDTTSNQYTLLTHLYSYFGGALGCTQYGQSGFPAYAGQASQYDVHRYMALDNDEVSYFIEQVGLAATSFGVTKDDATTAGTLLTSIFGVRCGPPTTVIPAQGPQLQSICTEPDCAQAKVNASCSLYQNVTEPANSTSTMPSPTASQTGSAGGGGSSGGASGSGSSGGAASSGAALANLDVNVGSVGKFAAALLALFAFGL